MSIIMLMVFVLGALSTSVAAQTSPVTEESGSAIVPLPAVFYQPETGLAFGAVLGFYGGQQASGRTSEILLSAIFTAKKQVLLDINFEQYPDGGQYWISGTMGYHKFPTKYWGLGNTTAESAEEDYTPRSFALEADVMRRTGGKNYAGLTLQLRARRLSEVAPNALLANRPGAGDQANVGGIGVVWTSDYRDQRLAPSRGGFLLVRAVEYPSFLTNATGFRSLAVDARRYFSPLPGTALAFRASWTSVSSGAPFDLLPVLGGRELLRGYFEGRYRDANLVALQSEYRFPIYGFIRGATFAEFGQVASQLSGFSLDGFKAALGGGVRLVLDRESRASIRVDYGWAFDVGSGGLYFGLGEAF